MAKPNPFQPAPSPFNPPAPSTPPPQSHLPAPNPFQPAPSPFNPPGSGGGSGGGGGSSPAPTPVSPPSGGTYDSGTGTYTSPSGSQQSMANAPAGALLIGGGGSSYSGGGTSSPNVFAKPETSLQTSTQQQVMRNISSTPPQIIDTSFIGGVKAFWRDIGGRDIYEAGKDIGKKLGVEQIKENIPIIKRDLGITAIGESKPVQKFGEVVGKGVEVLKKGEQAVEKYTEPEYYYLKQREQKALENYNTNIESLKKEAESLKNIQDVNEYNREVNSINARAEYYYNRYQKEIKVLEVKRQAYESSGIAVVSGVATGLVKSPFQVGEFFGGLVTEPITTLKETATGVIDLPKQALSSPRSAGEIAGSLIGQTLIFEAGVKGIKGLDLDFTSPEAVKNTKLTPLEELRQYGLIGKEGDLLFPKIRESVTGVKDYLADKYKGSVSYISDKIEMGVEKFGGYVAEKQAALGSNFLPGTTLRVGDYGLIGKQTFLEFLKESSPASYEKLSTIKNYISDKYLNTLDTFRLAGERITERLAPLRISEIEGVSNRYGLLYPSDAELLFPKLNEKITGIKENLSYGLETTKVKLSQLFEPFGKEMLGETTKSYGLLLPKDVEPLFPRVNKGIDVFKEYIEEKYYNTRLRLNKTIKNLDIIKAKDIFFEGDYGILGKEGEVLFPRIKESISKARKSASDFIDYTKMEIKTKTLNAIDLLKPSSYEPFRKARSNVLDYFDKKELLNYQKESRLLDLKNLIDEKANQQFILLSEDKIITKYHGTTLSSAYLIKEEGLIPGAMIKTKGIKLPEVFAGATRESVEGWAGKAVLDKGILNEERAILKLSLPESWYKENRTKRSDNNFAGVEGEEVFRSVPKQYIEIDIPDSVKQAIKDIESYKSNRRVTPEVEQAIRDIEKEHSAFQLRELSLKEKPIPTVEVQREVSPEVKKAIKQVEAEHTDFLIREQRLKQKPFIEMDIIKDNPEVKKAIKQVEAEHTDFLLRERRLNQKPIEFEFEQIRKKDSPEVLKAIRDIEKEHSEFGFRNLALKERTLPKVEVSKIAKKKPTYRVYEFKAPELPKGFKELETKGNQRLIQRQVLEEPKTETKLETALKKEQKQAPRLIQKTSVTDALQPRRLITGQKRILIRLGEEQLPKEKRTRLLYLPRQQQQLLQANRFNVNLRDLQIPLSKQDIQSAQQFGSPNVSLSVNQLVNENVMQQERVNERQRSRLRELQIFEDLNMKKLLREEDKKRKINRIKELKAYTLLLRKRGKYKQVGTNLTRGQALRLGSEKVLNDIARTFKIAETGRTKEVFGYQEDFMPSDIQFRAYQVKKGKRVPLTNTFIQRTSANLKSEAERFQLAEARRMAKLMKF